MPKRTKVDKKTYIVISILGTTSGGGAEKDNCSAETGKIGAENAKIQSAEKSAETGGNLKYSLSPRAHDKKILFCSKEGLGIFL